MEEKIRGNLLNSFVYLLDIKLREAIREDKGGSYGVSVYYDMNRIPEDNFYIEIGFGCEPGREDELVDELFKQIKLLQTELVDQSYVAKLSENCLLKSGIFPIIARISSRLYMPLAIA